MIDEAVAVLVDHVERLFELLDLILVEHGEYVGSRALCALLRARTPGRLAARHLGGLLTIWSKIKQFEHLHTITRVNLK